MEQELAQVQRDRTGAPCGDDSLSAFLRVRPRLFGIAYRVLGSAVEAEDVVQDVWLRWQAVDRCLVRDAPAFLAAATTRLAINVMQSARSRRETYLAPWLPEPVDTGADSGLGAERGEALELGVLVLLEKLSPTERAAYILREAFDYPYRDVANVLGLEEANARQVVTRARLHVANGRRMPASSTERRRLLGAFIAAAQHGDVAGLEGLLASDVVSASACVVARRTQPTELASSASICRNSVRHSVIASALSATSNRVDYERSCDHETRHHRRHRAHRVEARDQAA